MKLKTYKTTHVWALPFEFSWGYGMYAFSFLIWHIILYTDYEDIVKRQAECAKCIVKSIKSKAE